MRPSPSKRRASLSTCATASLPPPIVTYSQCTCHCSGCTASMITSGTRPHVPSRGAAPPPSSGT
eukprot:361323-Chlamydomonas_euryale.AAC.20